MPTKQTLPIYVVTVHFETGHPTSLGAVRALGKMIEERGQPTKMTSANGRWFFEWSCDLRERIELGKPAKITISLRNPWSHLDDRRQPVRLEVDKVWQ